MSKIVAYTDGSCKGNPGPGGWAVVLRYFDDDGQVIVEREIFGHEGESPTTPGTLPTNNQMELVACIKCLEMFSKYTSLTIYTDSQYICEGVAKLQDWLLSGWTKRDGKPLANANLWKRLKYLIQAHDVKFEWVKGHNQSALNVRADHLASEASQL